MTAVGHEYGYDDFCRVGRQAVDDLQLPPDLARQTVSAVWRITEFYPDDFGATDPRKPNRHIWRKR